MHTPGASPASGSAADAKPAKPRESTPPRVVLDAETKRKCYAIFKDATPTPVEPNMVISCFCRTRDQLHAQAAYARLSSNDRSTVKKACAELKVDIN